MLLFPSFWSFHVGYRSLALCYTYEYSGFYRSNTFDYYNVVFGILGKWRLFIDETFSMVDLHRVFKEKPVSRWTNQLTSYDLCFVRQLYTKYAKCATWQVPKKYRAKKRKC